MSNASEWIYVGAAGNIQAALLAHLQETGTRLKSFSPKGFTFEVCDAEHAAMRHSRLVGELAPPCNRP